VVITPPAASARRLPSRNFQQGKGVGLDARKPAGADAAGITIGRRIDQHQQPLRPVSGIAGNAVLGADIDRGHVAHRAITKYRVELALVILREEHRVIVQRKALTYGPSGTR
jgi:hypothetical protein